MEKNPFLNPNFCLVFQTDFIFLRKRQWRDVYKLLDWKTRQKERLRKSSFCCTVSSFHSGVSDTNVCLWVSHHHFTLFCTAAHLMYMLWSLTCRAFLHRFISSRVRIKPYISQRNDTLEKKTKPWEILWEMSNQSLLYFWFSIFF